MFFKLIPKKITRCPQTAFQRQYVETLGDSKVDKEILCSHQAKLLPESKYGGETIVTFKTGDDKLGEQGRRYMYQLIETTKVPVSFEYISSDSHNEYLVSFLRNRRALFVEPSIDPESKSAYFRLRNHLDLFATISKFYTMEGFGCKFPGANIIAIAQNTMGNIGKLEYEPVPGVAETLRVVTDECLVRFLRFAYEKAKQYCRKKVTIIHKTRNQQKFDGLFLDTAKQIHECEYPELKFEDENIDRLALNLVRNPLRYDVLISAQQYGSAVAAICASVCGKVDLYSSMELGDHHALFLPLQTKLSVVPLREVSPYSIVMCLFDLLEHVGRKDCAENLLCEMFRTMSEGIKTESFGGTDKGSFVICSICNRLRCRFAA